MREDYPKWTIVYNILSLENQKWIGTGWEFFDHWADAKNAYDRHILANNVPTLRPYYEYSDAKHLGAAHNV